MRENRDEERRKKKAIFWWFFVIFVTLFVAFTAFRERIFAFFGWGNSSQVGQNSIEGKKSDSEKNLGGKIKNPNEESKEDLDKKEESNSFEEQNSDNEELGKGGEVCFGMPSQNTGRSIASVGANSTPQNNAKNEALSQNNLQAGAQISKPEDSPKKNSDEKKEDSSQNQGENSDKNQENLNQNNGGNNDTKNQNPQGDNQNPQGDNPDQNQQNQGEENNGQNDTTPPQDQENNGGNTQNSPDNNDGNNNQNPPQDTPPEETPPKEKITDEMVTRVYDALKDVEVLDYVINSTDFSNVRITSTDRLALFSKKVAEWRRQNNNATPTADVTSRLMKEAEDELKTGQPRNQINNEHSRSIAAQKANLKVEIKKALENAARDLEAEDPEINKIADKIIANKEAFLLGSLYLDKFYNFEIGGQKLSDKLKNSPQDFKAGENSADWLIALGKNLTFEKLKTTENVKTFSSEISKLVGERDLTKFLDQQLEKAGISDKNQWFVEAAKAQIVEGNAPNGDKVHLYTRLKNLTNRQNMILPILTASEDLYAVSSYSSITFGSKKAYGADFATLLEKTAQNQTALNEIFYNLAPNSTRNNLKRDVIAVDTLLENGKSGSANWPEKYNNGRAEIEEFLAPMGLHRAWLQANAEADSNAMSFWMMRALTEAGQGTFTHELVHIIDKNTLFGGANYRTGADAEFYAMGLFEPPEKSDEANFGLNLTHDWTSNENRIHNSSPKNINSSDKIQKYMAGVFSTLYTLDHAETQAVLGKSNADKALWFKKMESKIANDGSTSDVFKNLTEAEIAQMNLTNINSLIENGIVSERYIYKGIQKVGEATKREQYYKVPMFSSIYGIAVNSSGISGPITFRRNAFELLALRGYEQGMLKYLTSQLENGQPKSDDQIAAEIFGAGKTFAQVRKDHYASVIARTGNLKPFDIELGGQTIRVENFAKLQQLMTEAVEKDLADIKRTGASAGFGQLNNTDQLKKAVMNSLIKSSQDFQNSIYN